MFLRTEIIKSPHNILSFSSATTHIFKIQNALSVTRLVRQVQLNQMYIKGYSQGWG